VYLLPRVHMSIAVITASASIECRIFSFLVGNPLRTYPPALFYVIARLDAQFSRNSKHEKAISAKLSRENRFRKDTLCRSGSPEIEKRKQMDTNFVAKHTHKFANRCPTEYQIAILLVSGLTRSSAFFEVNVLQKLPVFRIDVVEGGHVIFTRPSWWVEKICLKIDLTHFAP